MSWNDIDGETDADGGVDVICMWIKEAVYTWLLNVHGNTITSRHCPQTHIKEIKFKKQSVNI